MPEPTHQSGVNAYGRGCRCDGCQLAHRERMRDYYRSAKGVRPRVPCSAGCGRTTFSPDDLGRCGECKRLSRRTPEQVARRRAAQAKIRKAAKGKRSGWIWTAGTCNWCDSVLVVRSSGPARFCSAKCKAAAKSKRFKIRPAEREAIYERDGWTCQLCMEAVEPNADPLSDWYPSLDHIVPQSRSLVPDHSPANLRTAHRWCNSVRGDESHYTVADLAA